MDYKDQREDIEGQIDLTEEKKPKLSKEEFLELIEHLPINKALTRDYQRRKKEQEND